MSTALESALSRVDAQLPSEPADNLLQFSMRGQSDAMKQKMLDDVHVLGRIVLLGQFTVLYAPPNAGKTLLTLWLLREAIEDGRIDGERVFYVNCDDSYRGLVEKNEFSERVGFHQLADGQNGFRAGDLLGVLVRMVEGGDAHGAVVILDTFKKFTDLMDKSKQSEINKTLRAFVQSGGTLIALAHVNKHRDADGKNVESGTTDAKDDADCAYILDTSGADDECIVTFDNIKMRGNVARQVRYQYSSSEGVAWLDRLESVREASEDDAKTMRQHATVQETLKQYADVVQAVLVALADGPVKRSELEKTAMDDAGESRSVVRRVIKTCEGNDYTAGYRWKSERGNRNARLYHKLTPPYQELLDKTSLPAAYPAHRQTRQTGKLNSQEYREASHGE